MNNKLTDNEIIKAYEFCLKDKGCTGCVADKNSKSDEFDCKLKPQDIIDLFNRLQAEKQNLEIELKAMRGAANSYKAENKRLYIAFEENQKATKFWKDKSETAKAEAYKECIEKVKEYIDTHEHLTCEECECVPISKNGLDNFLKELVGEDK